MFVTNAYGAFQAIDIVLVKGIGLTADTSQVGYDTPIIRRTNFALDTVVVIDTLTSSNVALSDSTGMETSNFRGSFVGGTDSSSPILAMVECFPKTLYLEHYSMRYQRFG
jgi:hypothetical protein